MADEQRYHSIAVGGWGAETAAGVVLRALQDRPGLVVRQLSPTRLSVSRVRRARWSLLRRTEAGEIVVSDAPQGALVTVPPVVGDDIAAEIRRALTEVPVPMSPPAPSPETDTNVNPILAPSDLDGYTVARSGVETPAEAPPPPPRRAVLRFPAAAVTVMAGDSVVLGRAPTASDGETTHVVPGDASTVSKSHMRVNFDGAELTLQDLHSKNGSSIEHQGQTRTLSPGDSVIAASGDRVEMGMTSFVVTLE